MPSKDDLNSLYVYEAKMSLFIRMAQTRAGAERLLEAQLLPVLAQCDYLDTRPEADQAFIGKFRGYILCIFCLTHTCPQIRTRSCLRRFRDTINCLCLPSK